MNIQVFERQSLEELRPFIAKCNYVPFMEYGVRADLVTDYVINELSNIVSRCGLVLVAKEEAEIVGVASFEKLDWDSRIFGFDISKITHLLASGNYLNSLEVKQKLISYLLAECYHELFLHLSARIHKEDLSSVHALEGKSFRLMDVLVTYLFDLRKQTRIDPGAQYRIRRFEQNEIPELSEIAQKCFRENNLWTDRFHADPTLSKEKSGEVYVRWLIDSCEDSSSEILVAELDGKPVGFNICKLNLPFAETFGMRLGTIVLTAVDPSFRGRFVATSLMNASLSWFADKVDIVDTGGQVSNYAIQRVWNKSGFKMIKSQCTFHWSALPDAL